MQLTLQPDTSTNKQHDGAGNEHANEQVVESTLAYPAGNVVANKQPHQGGYRRHCIRRHVSLVKGPHLDVPENSGADNQHDSIGGAYHLLQAANGFATKTPVQQEPLLYRLVGTLASSDHPDSTKRPTDSSLQYAYFCFELR